VAELHTYAPLNARGGFKKWLAWNRGCPFVFSTAANCKLSAWLPAESVLQCLSKGSKSGSSAGSSKQTDSHILCSHHTCDHVMVRLLSQLLALILAAPVSFQRPVVKMAPSTLMELAAVSVNFQ